MTATINIAGAIHPRMGILNNGNARASATPDAIASTKRAFLDKFIAAAL
jgi:hypothetical protein